MLHTLLVSFEMEMFYLGHLCHLSNSWNVFPLGEHVKSSWCKHDAGRIIPSLECQSALLSDWAVRRAEISPVAPLCLIVGALGMRKHWGGNVLLWHTWRPPRSNNVRHALNWDLCRPCNPWPVTSFSQGPYDSACQDSTNFFPFLRSYKDCNYLFD